MPGPGTCAIRASVEVELSTNNNLSRAAPVSGEGTALPQGSAASERRARLDAMSAMASTMAHELSQPLTAANNYLQMSVQALRQHAAGISGLADAIENASRQTARAMELVRRTRDFVMTGQVQAVPEDLGEMLAHAAATVEGMAAVELSVALAPDARRVMADRMQIETVLANLLTNGVQAMRGLPAPCIHATSFLRDGAVFLRIEDSGPGIAEEHLARLFDPGFTTRTDASGLGLSICHTFVAAHRGALWAELSKPGQGGVFVLALPAAH